MATIRDRPYANFNFLVNLGVGDALEVQAGFTEVILPEARVDIIEYRNGNEKESGVRKLTGRERYENCILKRGVIGSLDLYAWWDDVRNGNDAVLRTVQIDLFSEDRTSPVLTWKLHRARPAAISFGPLQAAGKNILLESLELAFERLEVE